MRPNSSRFRCASSRLDFKRLLASGRRGLGCLAALSLCLHLALTTWTGHQADSKAVQPLTARFVKRAPRLTKPLELKKRPRPKRRDVHRRMVAAEARAHRSAQVQTFQPAQIVEGLARPTARLVRVAPLAAQGIEPHAASEMIAGARQAQQKIDTSLELLDIDALNTGQYHALVVQDPQDKKNIKGFCRLAVVYSPTIYPGRYPRFDDYIMPVVLNLTDAMNRYTDIHTDIFGRITLDAPELFSTPWVYFMAFYNFELPDSHLRGLGRYLTSGGFVFADTHPMPSHYAGGLHGLAENIKRAFHTQGIREAAFERLRNTHPLYHCYFDFGGPPPAGDTHSPIYHKPNYLEGIELDGHLSAILTTKGYWCPWAYHGPSARVKRAPYSTWDPGRQFQFGVNLIIFALTQEGSITHRLMESVDY